MIGSSIGPYEVLERLGAGGMGDVYLARDARLNRQVALKSLSDPSLDIPDARARLLQEARAAARLTHPNIAAIHDILDCDPRPCIVMEYVQGETLAAIVARGPMPAAQALSIGIQLADALAHAHAAGVIHRDLKPANVILTAEGTAKILDFGVARIRELAPDDTTTATLAEAPRSQAGQVSGTPAYMAPEQLMGRPASVRSDLYSLGMLLFELVTGHRAFAAPDFMGLALAILNAPTPIAHAENPAVPDEVSAIITRAIAREPRDRYQSASELKSALQHAARALMDQSTTAAVPLPTPGAGQTLEARSVPLPATTPVRRRWLAGWRLAASTAAGLAVCLLVIWLTVFPPPAASPIIAVLPLTNLTGNPNNDYIGVGVSESLTTALVRVPGVTVVSRNETGRQVGQGAVKIARELGASFLVDGAVQQSGSKIRFSVKLRKPDSRIVWSGDYEGTSDEVFARQQKAAGDLIGALGITLTPAQRQRVDRPLTANPDAYADYSIGRALLGRFDIAGNIERALSAFERATGKDPTFAAAYAGLGEAYWRRYHSENDPAWIPQAIASVLQALKLAPDDMNARLTLASIYSDVGKGDQAIAELQRATSAHPDNDEAHRLMASIHTKQGQYAEAVREGERAIAIRPDYFQNYIALGNVHYYKGEYVDAARAYQRATEVQPDAPWGYLNLGAIALKTGDYARAIEYLQQTLTVDPNQDKAYSNIGYAYHLQGRYAEAAKAFEHAVAMQPRNAASHRNLGDAYQRLGDRDKARTEYQHAAELTGDVLKVNPKDPGALASYALYCAKAGQLQDGLRHAERAVELARSNPDVLYTRAVVYALAGQGDEAANWLQQAVTAGYSRKQAREDEDLASITKLPRVEALLRDAR